MKNLAITALLALAACGSSGDSGPSNGGGDPGASSSGSSGSASGTGGATGTGGAGSVGSPASAGSGGGGGAASTGEGGAGTGGSGGGEPRIPWDWAGIIGTGQSLSVGTQPIMSTTQPFNNLKLSLGDLRVPPWDPGNAALTMVPLVEPIRPLANGAPAPAYPANIYGETGHAPMANQISFLIDEAAGRDYISVHTVIGENGQGIVALKKGATDTGTTGRAYAATLFEVAAITRLAQAAGKTYGVGAIFMTHGETDSLSATYGDELVKLWSDYNADLKEITGQTEEIPLFVSQQHGYPLGGNRRAVSTLAQWRLGVEHPGDIVCTGPKYHLPGRGDGVHLSSVGAQMMGEKYGQIYFERVVMGRDWQPLQPTRVERSGRVITVHFHVPVPPLTWDDTMPAPTVWENGRGFEVRQGDTKIEISSVEIDGDSVKITCRSDLPASGVTVGHAMTTHASARPNGFPTWGQLRDSDPFVGWVTKAAQPNYAVSFEMPVP